MFGRPAAGSTALRLQRLVDPLQGLPPAEALYQIGEVHARCLDSGSTAGRQQALCEVGTELGFEQSGGSGSHSELSKPKRGLQHTSS